MLNRNKAFTMIEMIISMSIMAFFVIAIAFSVNKRSQERIGQTTGGFFACYKDASNRLGYKTEIRYADTTFKDEGNTAVCSFEVPAGVTTVKIEVVGAGGGAGGADNPLIAFNSNDIFENISVPFSCPNEDVGTREYCSTNDGCNVLPQRPIPVNSDSIISNRLSDYMSDDVYEELMLRDITTTIQGGNDFYGNSGARCALTRNYNIGETVFCTLQGQQEEGPRDFGLANHEWTSSTKALLQVNGRDLLTAQGKVVYDGYSSLSGSNNDFSLTSTCVGGVNSTADIGVNYIGKRYKSSVLSSITLNVGSAGGAGEYIVREGQNVRDISNDGVITINADNIGDGGLAGALGENGQNGNSTSFNIPSLGNLVAAGGLGGRRTTFDCVLEKEKIETPVLEQREHPNSECYLQGDEAVPSSYVRDTLFPQLSAVAQAKYISQAGQCDEEDCTDAESAEIVSYGNGGSAGAVKVIYDYIEQFTLQDGPDEYATPLHEPEILVTEGANGSGGAIIISW